ncbi:ABC transporter substrate-binding protein [Neobacillus mesonae]|uniref:ABC transporter substrate-binding protein n=1 Tax=Neobacillus mesonae TaxID=1193713 RepID=UPI00203DDAAD|nr:ABC transporter substrate-binding protein [Neobacillus mesonae]MCM3571149.1 ABC transporter substrate-binding protein [Neobacillus mesonae]
MKKWYSVFLFLCVFALVATGCAGISGDSDVSGDAKSDGSNSKKQEMTVANDVGIISLDPYGSAHGEPATILAATQIYDTLVKNDGNKLVPSLATEWKQPDDLTWVFKLRDDVTFHDGTKLTAKDVKASLEQLVTRKESPLTVLWAQLDSVEATDDTTVTIKTKTPLGNLLYNLTLLYITPADQATSKDFFRKPIGSGPFRVESFQPDQDLKLSGNKDYWDGAPKLDSLTIKNIPENAARMTAIETGEIDATWTIPADLIDQLKQNKEINIMDTPSYFYYFNWFNSSEKPFDDVRVRKAMWYALDTKAIVKDLFGDTAEVMKAPIPSSIFGFSEQTPYEYNPEKAKQLLKEAGYPDGFETRMIWSKGSGPQILELQKALTSYWDKIGVKIVPDQLERAEWIEKLTALDWNMDLQTNAVISGDADYTLGRLYISQANRNGYKNEKLDELLIKAKQSTDADKRAQFYDQANKIIWDDAVGIFPLQLKQIYAVRKNVKGLEASPTGAPNFHKVSIE